MGQALAFTHSSEASPVSHAPGARRQFPARALAMLSGRDLEFTWALGVIALLPRLFVAIALTGDPVWDGHYYELGAQRIAEGFGYSEEVIRDGHAVTKPWAHYPVGYSAILSVFYKIFGARQEIFGSEISVGTLIGALTGAALAMVTHRLARYFLSENRSRMAGAVVALHPGLIAYAGVLMTEPIATLLVVLALYAQVALKSPRIRILTVGVIVGVATLVRPLSLSLLPVLFILDKRQTGARLLQTFWIALVSACVILPWTARNCRVMDGCALISTNGGWNLAIGAITESGRFEALKAQDGCPVVTGQVQQDRCWSQVGLQKILDDPVRWLSVAPRKLSQAYDHESFPIEYLHEARPELWPEPRRVRARELLTFFHRLLVSLAVFRFVLVRGPIGARESRVQSGLGAFLGALVFYCFQSDSHPFYLLVLLVVGLPLLPLPGKPDLGPMGRALVLFVALTTASHIVFFGEDRYHFVLVPLFALLAASSFERQLPPGLLARAQGGT